MIELFPDITQDFRDKVKFWVDYSLSFENPVEGAACLCRFADTIKSEKEKQYYTFALRAELARIKGVYNENLFN